METGRLLLSVIFFLGVTFSLIIRSAEANPRADIVARICSNEKMEIGNVSYYQETFTKILTEVEDVLPAAKFATKDAGEPPDKIYVLAQCMEDLSAKECRTCFSQMRTFLLSCFPATGGRIYLDGCFLRGDNYSFFQETQTSSDYLKCSEEINSNSDFGDAAKSVIDELTLRAPAQDGFAAYNATQNGSTIYGMASCWKTLLHDECASCLSGAAMAAMVCLPSTEVRVLNAGCFLRYSNYEFVNDIESPTSLDDKLLRVSNALGVVSICILAIVIGFYFGRATYERLNRQTQAKVEVDSSVVKRSLQFKYTTLEKATDHFSVANKLGQGGFGEVFKGTLEDGREIAIKRLFIRGQSRTQEVYNEIDIIGSACHKNLVRLLGCCFTNRDNLLVYEFLLNRSLDQVLFDSKKKKELPWKIRLGIIMGIAEGLEYLHTGCHVGIIHRDIKASNILLDLRYRPKISDFGLASFHSTDKAIFSIAIAGTLGYMAPEYLAEGRLTEKVDVYSYGVLILELVSGVQNNKYQLDDPVNSLVTATWKHFQSKTLSAIVDQSMEIEEMEEVMRVIQVGLLCTQESPTLRPTMTEIIQMLEQKDGSLPTPTKPPFTEENLIVTHPAVGSPRRSADDASDTFISCAHSDTNIR